MEYIIAFLAVGLIVFGIVQWVRNANPDDDLVYERVRTEWGDPPKMEEVKEDHLLNCLARYFPEEHECSCDEDVPTLL